MDKLTAYTDGVAVDYPDLARQLTPFAGMAEAMTIAISVRTSIRL